MPTIKLVPTYFYRNDYFFPQSKLTNPNSKDIIVIINVNPLTIYNQSPIAATIAVDLKRSIFTKS
ncbi:TPA: hypothetical protein ACGFEA_004999, partial [Escherichia coli]